jgi:hypothetical protein
MDEGRFFISAQALYHRLGTAAAPLVVDVPRAAAFDADDRMLIAAVRREPTEIRHGSGETVPVRGFGLAFDMPVLASVNPWAFLLSLAAIVAIFRFKAGTIQTSPTPRPPGSSFT